MVELRNNGSGKTALVNVISGFLKPDECCVEIYEQDLEIDKNNLLKITELIKQLKQDSKTILQAGQIK